MHPREVHLLGEAGEDGHVERAIDGAQVLPDHLLGQALAGDQEPGHGGRGVLQEAPLDQVDDTLVRLLVEDIEAGSIMPLADHFIDGVHVADQVGRGGWAHHG